MRLVVQRVKQAKVTRVSDQKVVGQIEEGLFVLLGIKKGDTEKDVEKLSEKLVKLRVMSDSEDKMNLSIKDAKDKVLLVSQFTLHGDVNGGNRPSFLNAEAPDRARELYDLFISKLKEKEVEVEIGSFGEYMQIETVLDGPVTILYLD
jgi:D-tyrosyl-tRNA(Tyr) deacylase